MWKKGGAALGIMSHALTCTGVAPHDRATGPQTRSPQTTHLPVVGSLRRHFPVADVLQRKSPTRPKCMRRCACMALRLPRAPPWLIYPT